MIITTRTTKAALIAEHDRMVAELSEAHQQRTAALLLAAAAALVALLF